MFVVWSILALETFKHHLLFFTPLPLLPSLPQSLLSHISPSPLFHSPLLALLPSIPPFSLTQSLTHSLPPHSLTHSLPRSPRFQRR